MLRRAEEPRRVAASHRERRTEPAAQGGQEEGEEEVGAEAALVKGRNEPCELDVVLHVLAAARGEEPAALAAPILVNTRRCFGE